MTQVSKRYLSPEAQKRMHTILIKAIVKANSKGDVIHLLTDLLSRTEQLMLAKRLAIAYLLIKKEYTHREISKILKVSVTTIQRVTLSLNLDGNGYRKVIKSLMNEEKVEDFMNKIADVITSIPPAKNDWKTWRANREQEKRERSKAF